MRRLFYVVSIAAIAVILGATGWYGFQTYYYYHGPSEKLLSQTGFDSVVADAKSKTSTFRFQPQYPFWSDGAAKKRYIFIPPNTQIDNSDPDRWNFPNGTRIWKEFTRDGVAVEVRMLFKFGDQASDWDMSVYRWRKDFSDAYKVMFSRANVGGTAHDIPSPSQCVTCHSAGENRRPLGITAIQLPWEHETDLSISKLMAARLLTNPPATAYTIPGNDLTQAALGYLDTNCGSCHYDGSTFVPPAVPLFLNLTTTTLNSVSMTNAYRTAIDATPYVAGLGTEVYVRPGLPEKSFLYIRMTKRDNGGWQMPPIATEVVDSTGAKRIKHWIESLGNDL